MQRKFSLIGFLLVLSGIAGYWLSKASLVGRVGISLFYKQYRFIKTWWQGGLLVFGVWMLLFLLHTWVQRKTTPATFKLIQFAFIALAAAGLYFTYQDFRHTVSHRWLGERFHLGGYLFWLGWIIISVYFLTGSKKTALPPGDFSSKENLPKASHRNM